jgi:hypothetical protein
MAFISCDALLFMPYYVKNNTGEKIKLKITGYPVSMPMFSPGVDTIIELAPKKYALLGTAHGIGFPWDTKSLFHEKPGCQNFELMLGDSILAIDLSDKNWIYRSSTSVFKVQKKHLYPENKK